MFTSGIILVCIAVIFATSSIDAIGMESQFAVPQRRGSAILSRYGRALLSRYGKRSAAAPIENVEDRRTDENGQNYRYGKIWRVFFYV